MDGGDMSPLGRDSERESPRRYRRLRANPVRIC